MFQLVPLTSRHGTPEKLVRRHWRVESLLDRDRVGYLETPLSGDLFIAECGACGAA